MFFVSKCSSHFITKWWTSISAIFVPDPSTLPQSAPSFHYIVWLVQDVLQKFLGLMMVNISFVGSKPWRSNRKKYKPHTTIWPHVVPDGWPDQGTVRDPRLYSNGVIRTCHVHDPWCWYHDCSWKSCRSCTLSSPWDIAGKKGSGQSRLGPRAPTCLNPLHPPYTRPSATVILYINCSTDISISVEQHLI